MKKRFISLLIDIDKPNAADRGCVADQPQRVTEMKDRGMIQRLNNCEAAAAGRGRHSRDPMRQFLASAFALFTGLFLCSCATSQRNQFIREADYSEPIRVACVGDSITYGYGFKDRERESYPAQLDALLGENWDVQGFGVNGATLLKDGTRPYFTQQAYRDALAFKPDVVIIKLGTNDTKKENYGTHKAEFASDYLELIESFSKLETRPRIYLCRPVPIFRDRGKAFDTDKVLTEEIIPEINAVAEKAKLPVIDLYAAFENKPELFPDGVHPNVKGAGIIARDIYTALTGKIAE